MKCRKRKNKYNYGGFLEVPQITGINAVNMPTSFEGNIPALGSISNTTNLLGKSTGALGAIGNIVNAGISNSKIADTTGIEQNITNQSQRTSTANSNDMLMQDWAAFNPLQDISHSDIRGGSTGQRLANTAGAALSGASAGMQIGGPIGGIVGGVVGLGSSVAGWLTGNAKAKKEARELNRKMDIANARAVSSLSNTADNIDKQNHFNTMANFSAYGGNLNRYDIGGNLLLDIPASGRNGGIFDNGVDIINNGGTHEENKMQGVQIGVDPEGIPNLVEEGEVIYNNYVFSNRLKPNKKIKQKFSWKGNTFADIAKEIQKESSERPNDPISKRGLEDSMMKLQISQEDMKNKSTKEVPTNMFSTGGTITNPYRLTPYGGDSPRIPNSRIDDITAAAMLGDPLVPEQFKVPEQLRSDYMNAFYNRVNSVDNPNKGFFGTNTSPDTRRLITDGIRNVNYANRFKNTKPLDTPLAQVSSTKASTPNITFGTQNPYVETTIPTASRSKGLDAKLLRYAPTVANGINVLTDAFGLTNAPDYSNADLIANASNNIRDVQFDPIGNYLDYTPLDRDYYINKLNAQSGATRRAINNQAAGNSGNAMAGILAADYNAQGRLGDLARQAEEYNLAQRERVEGFNRGTNQFNSQMQLQADSSNQNADARRLSGTMAQAQMREQIMRNAWASRSNNLQNFINNLGDIGIEATERGRFNTYMRNSGVTLTDAELLNLGYKSAKSQGVSDARLRKLFPNKYKD